MPEPNPHTLEKKMTEFVETIAEKCFGGRLPPYPDLIAQAASELIPPLCEADGETLDHFMIVFLDSLYFHLIVRAERDLLVDLDPPSETVN